MTGAITPDGCPVEVYRRLPAMGEELVVHGAIPAGASILELGSGAGRITSALLALGHPVVAVDESPEMLAHVTGAETVCSTIDALELGRRFDCVLLGSHLINVPSADDRSALLRTCARHVAADGRVIIEWHPPAWFEGVRDSSPVGVAGLTIQLTDVLRHGELLDATVRYADGTDCWAQPFTAARISESHLHALLTDTGFALTDWLTPDRGWFAARPIGDAIASGH